MLDAECLVAGPLPFGFGQAQPPKEQGAIALWTHHLQGWTAEWCNAKRVTDRDLGGLTPSIIERLYGCEMLPLWQETTRASAEGSAVPTRYSLAHFYVWHWVWNQTLGEGFGYFLTVGEKGREGVPLAKPLAEHRCVVFPGE